MARRESNPRGYALPVEHEPGESGRGSNPRLPLQRAGSIDHTTVVKCSGRCYVWFGGCGVEGHAPVVKGEVRDGIASREENPEPESSPASRLRPLPDEHPGGRFPPIEGQDVIGAGPSFLRVNNDGRFSRFSALPPS